MTNFLFTMAGYGIDDQDLVFPPSRVAVQVYVMHRLECDGIQPSTMEHDLRALRCAIHQVEPLGDALPFAPEAALAVCRIGFAQAGAIRMYACPPVRQRPVETEEVQRLALWLLERPTPFHMLVLFQHLCHYFGLMRRGAVRWLTWKAEPGRLEFTADSHVQIGRWSGGLCVNLFVYKDKNLLGGCRRITIPDKIPLLPGFSFVQLLKDLLRLRTRDYGCVLGSNQRLFRACPAREQATFEEAELRRSRRIVCQILGDPRIATTAFRRGYVWALYRHDVSRDKLAKLGFWSPESEAMDVYSGVSGEERCEHITAITAGDIVHV